MEPNPAYVGQTVTVRGSGFNTTPYPGDTYPMAACVAGDGPVRIQPDGTFVIQTSYSGPGTIGIYAQDKWGHTSNTVNLTITQPVTFSVSIYDTTAAPYTGNGVMCIKYPANCNFHYENSFIGSTYTTKMPYNGTSAEIWVRQNPITTDHKTIQNIRAGQTYSISLTMPIPSPSPSTQTATPTPTQSPQATPTSTPGSASTTPGTPDTVAPATMLNLTGVKDASGIFTSNVVCTLTATDNDGGSGVNDTSYSFDGTNWTAYAGPFTVSTPGITSVFYRSTDKAGNQEVTRVEAVTIAGSASATEGRKARAACRHCFYRSSRQGP